MVVNVGATAHEDIKDVDAVVVGYASLPPMMTILRPTRVAECAWHGGGRSPRDGTTASSLIAE